MSPALSAFVLLATLVFPGAALLAADDGAACKNPSPDCAVVGQWNVSLALGYGQRSNPVLGRSDIPLVLIPSVSYYGKRFFLENLELGFTLHETERNTFNLIATPGYDRVFFFKHDLQNIFTNGGAVNLANGPSFQADAELLRSEPLRRRHSTYLLGPEWGFSYGRFIGQMDALYEVSGRHRGYEVRAAVATPIMRAEHSQADYSQPGYSQAGYSLMASVGLTWKSSALVRYYYGIEDVYEPGSAVNPFVKLGYTRPIAERWTLTAFVHYEYLGDAIGDSPIISGHGVTTFFAGLAFRIL